MGWECAWLWSECSELTWEGMEELRESRMGGTWGAAQNGGAVCEVKACYWLATVKAWRKALTRISGTTERRSVHCCGVVAPWHSSTSGAGIILAWGCDLGMKAGAATWCLDRRSHGVHAGRVGQTPFVGSYVAGTPSLSKERLCMGERQGWQSPPPLCSNRDCAIPVLGCYSSCMHLHCKRAGMYKYMVLPLSGRATALRTSCDAVFLARTMHVALRWMGGGGGEPTLLTAHTCPRRRGEFLLAWVYQGGGKGGSTQGSELRQLVREGMGGCSFGFGVGVQCRVCRRSPTKLSDTAAGVPLGLLGAHVGWGSRTLSLIGPTKADTVHAGARLRHGSPLCTFRVSGTSGGKRFHESLATSPICS